MAEKMSVDDLERKEEELFRTGPLSVLTTSVKTNSQVRAMGLRWKGSGGLLAAALLLHAHKWDGILAMQQEGSAVGVGARVCWRRSAAAPHGMRDYPAAHASPHPPPHPRPIRRS